ncbi:MAG: hypothetical protein MHPSP_004274, partial [Paramarteilia canceri]
YEYDSDNSSDSVVYHTDVNSTLQKNTLSGGTVKLRRNKTNNNVNYEQETLTQRRRRSTFLLNIINDQDDIEKASK